LQSPRKKYKAKRKEIGMHLFQQWLSPHKNNRNRITSEDIQYVLHHPTEFHLIHTLTHEYQDIVIPTTIPVFSEESVINEMITHIDVPDKPIIIYGKNNHDETIETKYQQLKSLGIEEIYIYSGGMFEWLLLNDIYGSTEFPIQSSTKKLPDIWKYRPTRILPIR